MIKISPLHMLPPLIFAGLAAVLIFGVNRTNRDQLPSMFIGQPAPEMQLTGLRGDLPPTAADLATGDVKLVNFWASWCGPCREEHRYLQEFADSGVDIIGINYKDEPQNALSFLAELGDPFALLGADTSGRTSIDWGVYGVPETFVIDGQGRVVARYPGQLTREVINNVILPAMAEAANPDSAPAEPATE